MVKRRDKHNDINDNDTNNEAGEMLNEEYGVNDNDTENADEMNFDLSDDNVNEGQTEEQIAAAFKDAEKDASSDSESDDDEDESVIIDNKDATPVKLDIDAPVVWALLDDLYKDADANDPQTAVAKQMAFGYVVMALTSYNSTIDIDSALKASHFSEATDDVFDRAKEVAEKNPTGFTDIRYRKALELKEEYEKAVQALSAQLKEDLGIKPLSDDDRKAEGEKAKANKEMFANALTAMERFNEFQVGEPMKPVIDYLNNLPPMPSISASGKVSSAPKKFGTSSETAEFRPRLGQANGGGVVYNGVTYGSFTQLSRKLKTVLEDDSIKGMDIGKQWLEEAGVSEWGNVPIGEPITFTVVSPKSGKEAEVTVIRQAA